jgi:hypothetical protein
MGARHHNIAARGEGKPQTFDFLGFTHSCATTRDGRFTLKMKTNRKKYTAAVLNQKTWLKRARTQPIKKIWKAMARKLQGHYNYYGVSGNFDTIKCYYEQSRALTFKWLNRRSQKRSWSWEQFKVYLDKHPLPKPKVTYEIYNTW